MTQSTILREACQQLPAERSTGVDLVTGAPGWLGTSLVSALRSGAELPAMKVAPRRVRCVVQPGVDTTPLKQLGRDVEIVQVDLRDRRQLEAVCRDAVNVFHCAGIIHPKRIQELYDTNVAGTKNLLDSAIAAQAKRFILVSSNSPAGLNISPAVLMREDDPPRPYLNYGLSKLQAEWLVGQAQRAGKIECVILRPCWFYGPNQPARQSKFFRMIKGGKPIIIGRGDNLRSMTYVDNAVQGLLLAAEVDAAVGRTFWIADKRPYSFIEIIETVARILDVPSRPRYLPAFGSDVARFIDSLMQMTGFYNQEIHVAGELAASIAVSIEQACEVLGYQPQVELEEGMRRSIAWCRANGQEF
jgi:nucleoside-diphosphate-sugar epimerase